MVEKPCSPYEKVAPRGSKPQAFQPNVSIGRSWQMAVVPGGDNYYQELGKDGCWEKPWRPGHSHHLDALALVDQGSFDIEMLMNVAGNQAGILDSAGLHLEHSLGDGARLKDWIEKFIGQKVQVEPCIAWDTVSLITLQQIFLELGLKSLDSCALALYTKASDGMKARETFIVLGTKAPAEALQAVDLAWLKADQKVSLPEGLKGKTLLVLRLEIQVESLVKLLEALGLHSEKFVETRLRLADDLVLITYGYAGGGYGLGEYGV